LTALTENRPPGEDGARIQR